MKSFRKLIDSDIVLFDVGARNGITDLSELRNYVAAYGFEPSAVEYQKLITNSTDLESIRPESRVHYKVEKYFPYAVGSVSGETTLFITKGAGASSTLKPNTELVSRFKRWRWGENLTVLREERVISKTLTEVLKEAEIDHIDYLKLDTQGNEYDILAAPGLLDRVSLIKTEVEFIPLYESQKLHHEISSLLYSRGYIQFDLKFESTHYRYVNTEPVAGGVLTWADAYYLRIDLKDESLLRKQAVALMGMGYEDISLDLVRRHQLLSDADFFDAMRELRAAKHRSLDWKRRMKLNIERLCGVSVSRCQKIGG